MLEHCCGDLLPFSHRSISEVGHWCWAIRPGSQSAFQFIPKVFDGVEVRALCRPVKFFHTDKPFLYGLRLVHEGHCHAETGKVLPQTVVTNLETKKSSRMSLYAVALRSPSTGTKGPEPWKTAPDHYSPSTKLYSWHYALGQIAFSWHLPNPDLSVGLPDCDAWFITPENAFPLLQSPMAMSFRPFQSLIVDRGRSSRAEIWQTDLLERWHSVTVPRWKSLSSSVRPFYCQCLSLEIAWLGARFYTPVSNGCGWNSRIHWFEGVSTYFCTSSVSPHAMQLSCSL